MASPTDSLDDNLPPPGMGEIGRAVVRLANDMAEIRSEMKDTYVRKDVWERSELNAGLRVGEVAHDVADVRVELEKLGNKYASLMRLVFTALAAPIITTVVAGAVLYIITKAIS